MNDQPDADAFADAVDQPAKTTKRPPKYDPIDLFGDASITGAPELTHDMLPRVVWRYADDNARRIGLNMASIAIPCLVACAAAIRDGWVIQPKLRDYTWKERPILWCALSGPSGAAKTAALRSAMVPLYAREEIWRSDDRAALSDWKEEEAAHKEEMKEWRKAGRDPATKPELPPRPPQRRLVIGDTTIEKVMDVAADNPDGFVQFRDELAAWIASFDQYGNGAGGRDKAIYLSAYNGDPASVDRVGKETWVKRLSMSVLGGIQDDLMKKKIGKMEADGFLARFLFVEARAEAGVDIEPDKQVLVDYDTLVSNLTQRHPPVGTDEAVVRMSKGAAAIRKDLYDFRRSLQTLPTIVAGLKDHLSKWDGMFARLCLIYHMIEHSEFGRHPEKVEVSEETALKVQKLMTRFFLPEAVRMHVEVLAQDDHMANSRWIAGHILAHKLEQISVYQIRRAFSALRNEERAILEAMRALEMMAWVKPKDTPGRAGGDFRKMKWLVNPRAHQVFEDRAERERARREQQVKNIQLSAKKASEMR